MHVGSFMGTKRFIGKEGRRQAGRLCAEQNHLGISPFSSPGIEPYGPQPSGASSCNSF